MKRIILNLNEELVEKIDSERSKHGTSRSEFVRRSILQHITHEKIIETNKPSLEELKAIVNPTAPKDTILFVKEDKFKENKERKITSSWSA